MKHLSFLTCAVLIAATGLVGCSCSSDNDDSGNMSYENYSDESTSSASTLRFHSSRDVYSYLNGKTFSNDGVRVRFYNNGQSVDVNNTNISNNVSISDIGINDNNVAYATVRVANPAGITTTFTLLAVDGHAQLIDPNDGSIYSY